jgi:3-oxoacyl-[acyl-carrier protein] reductase
MERLLWKCLEGANLISRKIVIITGAASGIGQACARMFSQQGGLLALVDLDYEALQKTCKEIESQGGKALAIKADVTRERDLDRIFQATHDAYHGLNVLINNVGGGRATDFFEIGIDEWKQVIDLNLTSVFLISQRASDIFRKQKEGVIVNVSSQAGRSVSPTAGCHYTSSKAAVLGLTRHMARILAPYNIRVNAVCPGITNSERIMKRLEAQGKMEEVARAIPLGRIGDVYEVAGCCLFLASDLSAYVTGATLDVNGGSLMI